MTRLRSFLALVLLVPAVAAAQPGERILDYTIEIDVRADASLDVTEHITVRAERQQIRRGIYRDFPTRYRDRYGNDVVVGLDVLGVERDGRPEPWFTERLRNGVRINTGNDDLLPRFPADYRFTIRYRTTRQIGFFPTHDELYWNAIGTGWVLPIDAARVEVRLPVPVPVAEMEAEGYTGPQGAQGRAYEASLPAPGVARWVLTEPLRAHEGLTIVLSFPKGILPEPSAAERAAWLLADNRGVLVALVGLIVLLVYAVRRWHQVGRDPRPGVIIPRYEPPEGRSPAELRYLARRRYDPRCFTSDLLLAAVQGHVRIERESRWLFGDRWRLEQMRRDGARPPFATAAALLERIFANDPDGTVELEKKNAVRLQGAYRAHAKALNERLHGSHFQRNKGSIVIAAAIAGVFAWAAFQVAGGGGEPAIVAISIVMALVVLAFAYLVQAPTPAGRRLLDEAEGLRLYLSVAERDELAALGGPGAPPPLDAKRYETLLPYAVALGVEEAWTRKFTAAAGAAAAEAAAGHMAWYRGSGASDLGSLAKAVGGSLTASIAAASTPPGSSSGRGGGGSSGGGGGGGGGGGR